MDNFINNDKFDIFEYKSLTLLNIFYIKFFISFYKIYYIIFKDCLFTTNL